MARGRPAITAARVLNYWREHGPCPIMQVHRVTGADRSHIYRIFRVEEKKTGERILPHYAG